MPHPCHHVVMGASVETPLPLLSPRRSDILDVGASMDLRPSLHHYRTSIGPQDMIKKLSAERGKLIHAHESSAKPRKAHISYTFGAIQEPLKPSPNPLKILRNHSNPPKFFACGAMERSKRVRTFHLLRCRPPTTPRSNTPVGRYAPSLPQGLRSSFVKRFLAT